MKKAIITFGVGYDFDNIKYFIHSCRMNAPDAMVFIFVGANIDKLKNDCRDYSNVTFIRYRQNFFANVISKMMARVPAVAKMYARGLRAIHRQNFARPLLSTLATPLVQFMVKRFFIIEAFIKTIPHEFIMLTDIRDVVIQDDPFRHVSENTIMTGIEPVSTGECSMNSKWIRQTYSDNSLGLLKNKQIACAGVTIGSRRAIQQYVHEMIEDVFNNLDKIIGMLGADQAIHIRLFYEQLEGLTKRFEANGKGSIATLHFSNLSEFRMADGKVNNLNDERLAVVHQYDRHTALSAYIKSTLEQSIKNYAGTML
jgi:hypothetical protein